MSRSLAKFSAPAAGQLALAVLLLAPARETSALDPSRALGDYVRRLWRTADGLPQNSVRQLIQSRNGYLWLGTPNGIARFDGVRFTVFNRGTTPGMRDDEVQALFEDRRGQIWFGTRAGLGRLRGNEVSFFGLAEGLIGTNVYAVGEDAAGGIWVGTTVGLSVLRGDRAQSFTTSEGLASNGVRVLHWDGRGRLWVGAGGLHVFESGRFERAGDGILDQRPTAISEDHRGELWLGTIDGLRRVRDGKVTTRGVPEELLRREIRTLLHDREGTLWIGTVAGGLYRLRGGELEQLTEREGLGHDTIFALYEDRERNLWVGSRAGLERLKDPAVTLYGTAHGLPNEHIKTVYEDRRGDLWIGTEHGLVRRRAGRFEPWRGEALLESASVWAIHEDRHGALWIGTRRDGLFRIAAGRVTQFTVKDGLASDEVRALHADARGDLWIGCGRGLTRLRDGRLKRYTETEGVVGQNFRAIAEDQSGDLWFGTDDGGLQLYRAGRFTTWSARNGLANDAVRALLPAQDGTLWIGTRHGLTRLRDGRFKSYTLDDGLFDDTILQVLEDGRGHLWMSSGRGVFRVSLAQLEDSAGGKLRSLASTAYGEADGMRSSECEGGSQPAGVRARDGRLWFPTTQGLAVIDPGKVRPNQIPPPVLIEGFRVNGEAIDRNQEVQLPAGRERFEFHYTGLSLTAPDKVRFRYRLHGLDRDWIDAGDRRVAYYTTIAPGRYRFQVIAANNDGVWNEQGASVEFVLEPRFHQTAAFYVLCGVGIALAAAGWHRLRLRRVHARFAAVLQERARMAGEIHDTVLQGFTALILHLAAFVRELPEPQQARLGRLLTEAEEYLDEARLSIWDMRADSGRTLSDAVTRLLEPLRAESPVPVRIDVQGEPRRLPGGSQLQVLRVAREAVTNALQHAHATAIQVQLAFRPHEVCLSVADDGRGFEPEALAARSDGHYGMLGMHERAQRLGVTLNVRSEPGKGTEISLAVPDLASHAPRPA